MSYGTWVLCGQPTLDKTKTTIQASGKSSKDCIGMVYSSFSINSQPLEGEFYVMAPKFLQIDLVLGRRLAKAAIDLQHTHVAQEKDPTMTIQKSQGASPTTSATTTMYQEPAPPIQQKQVPTLLKKETSPKEDASSLKPHDRQIKSQEGVGNAKDLAKKPTTTSIDGQDRGKAKEESTPISHHCLGDNLNQETTTSSSTSASPKNKPTQVPPTERTVKSFKENNRYTQTNNNSIGYTTIWVPKKLREAQDGQKKIWLPKSLIPPKSMQVPTFAKRQRRPKD